MVNINNINKHFIKDNNIIKVLKTIKIGSLISIEIKLEEDRIKTINGILVNKKIKNIESSFTISTIVVREKIYRSFKTNSPLLISLKKI